jgi:large subunit ribosomal protein L14
MIKLGCLLKVSDNTGINKVKFIGTLKKKKTLKVGDIVIVSIQKTTSPIYKKSSIVMAILIKTKKPLLRKDGSTLRFNENCVLIIDKTLTPKGTHIFGPIPYEIKYKYKKVTSLTNNFV